MEMQAVEYGFYIFPSCAVLYVTLAAFAHNELIQKYTWLAATTVALSAGENKIRDPNH